MKEPIFTGSGTAIVTPFRKDDILKVDYDKLDELIEFQIAGGTQAIIINGTTGENPTQTVEEHADVVRHDLVRQIVEAYERAGQQGRPAAAK